jgi:hypothetical protein
VPPARIDRRKVPKRWELNPHANSPGNLLFVCAPPI